MSPTASKAEYLMCPGSLIFVKGIRVQKTFSTEHANCATNLLSWEEKEKLQAVFRHNCQAKYFYQAGSRLRPSRESLLNAVKQAYQTEQTVPIFVDCTVETASVLCLDNKQSVCYNKHSILWPFFTFIKSHFRFISGKLSIK